MPTPSGPEAPCGLGMEQESLQQSRTGCKDDWTWPLQEMNDLGLQGRGTHMVEKRQTRM